MKSYRDCPDWKKNGQRTSRRKALKNDADFCINAVNCRACRRCPYVPRGKLRSWAEETEKQRKQNRDSPALLTTPFNTVPQDEPDHPEFLAQTVKDNPIDPTVEDVTCEDCAKVDCEIRGNNKPMPCRDFKSKKGDILGENYSRELNERLENEQSET